MKFFDRILRRIPFRIVSAFFGSVLAANVACADDPSPSPTPSPETSKAVTQELVRQTSLLNILNGISKLEVELRSRQEELRSPAGQGRQAEITQQIQETANKLDQLHHNFTEIAAGVDPESFTTKPERNDVDFTRDLREIMSPLINEVRRLTSRPREMDRLHTSVEEQEGQLVLIEQAKDNLEKLLSHKPDPRIVAELKNLQEDFDSRKQNITTQLGITRQKLDRRLSEQSSIGESVQNIFQLFFKSRGLNLVFALLAALLFWIFARRVHHVTGRLFPQSREKPFYERLISVALMLATVFGAVVVFLVTLYFVGDWVLLILALMLILGIIWTSKQAVHQFWNHAATLLNMGACREGERLILNGLPWELRSLSLYCNLINPALAGGDILLPIRDLATLRSRAFDADERWFPTLTGDWVKLENGDIGQIELQSVETVRVRLNGGMEVEFPTTKFLELPVQNLSRGFRHKVILTLDYRHQSQILKEIPGILESAIEAELKRAGFSEQLVKIDIELEEAGSSSLNLEVEADFHGTAASRYKDTRRAISIAFIECCNKHGWVIPFTQLTVHMEKAA